MENKVELPREHQELLESRACPCYYLDTPCNKDCTCKKAFSSYGCDNCCTYGHKEQRKQIAEYLNNCRLEFVKNTKNGR